MTDIHCAHLPKWQASGPKFKHVILTRFNVRYVDDPNVPSIGIDSGWLTDRFDLFERFCLPSVQSQTAQSFCWILFFDRATPEPFAARARALASLNRNYIPVFCAGLSDEVKEAVQNALEEKPQWLLTSRLDNDDGLHPDFAATVQKAQRFEVAEVLNCPRGIILHADRAYRRRDPSNAFISLSEPFEQFSTVFGILRHVDAHKSYPVRQVASSPMWLQVVHTNNISNRVRGWRVSMASAAKEYPALIAAAGRKRESAARIWAENLTLSPARASRDILVATVRRIVKAFGFELRRKAKVAPRPHSDEQRGTDAEFGV